ncbi:DUF2225 domain-containing protein [Carboxydothermus hydrogenoformans]|uniref:DUF2225 domain-containing protein n=1 Tax=Carboxydothermus hydrogenoformans TaxID=129958 RepID=UPI0005A0E838|nr:DUF2225 domain-containing protein [Carboxydothermus hydrogenoformans]
MNQDLYAKTIKCPLCGNEYKTLKVKTSALRPAGMDGDLCMRYSGLNPLYYKVNVCPQCFYAFTDEFTNIKKTELELLKNELAKNPLPFNFCGERDFTLAVKSYGQALKCALLKKEKDSIIGRLCHNLACLYRTQGELENEEKYLHYALNYYEKAFTTEANAKDTYTLAYLIGELSRRLKDYEKAAKWFGYLLQNKNMLPQKLVNLVQEQWQVLREEKRWYSSKLV